MVVPTTAPVLGSNGPCPATKTRPPAFTAWLYAATFGASSVYTMTLVTSFSSQPYLSGWRDVLIHMEQIGWVICCLDLSQPGVVVTIRGFYVVRSLIHHHIDIAPTRRMGV